MTPAPWMLAPSTPPRVGAAALDRRSPPPRLTLPASLAFGAAAGAISGTFVAAVVGSPLVMGAALGALGGVASDLATRLLLRAWTALEDRESWV